MKLAKKNPEASLNKLLTTISADGMDWHGFVFEPASKISHDKMVTPFHHINGKLHKRTMRGFEFSPRLFERRLGRAPATSRPSTDPKPPRGRLHHATCREQGLR